MATAEKFSSLQTTVGNTKRILVVDDDEDGRRIFREMLGGLGYAVIDQPDGESALRAIRGGSRVDLVITDERMPGLSGLELIESLRHKYPSIPVILVTAHGGVEDYLRSIGLGVFEYINKPVTKKEIAAIVNAALNNCSSKETS